MKKIISLSIIAMLLVTLVYTLTGCGSSGGETTTPEEEKETTKTVTATTTSKSRPFTITAKFPTKEVTNEAGETEIVADCEVEEKVDVITLKGKDVQIKAELSSFTYNTYANYKAKYGDKETNFANYMEYLEDSEFDGQKSSNQKKYEKVKIAGFDAIKSEFNGTDIYVIDNATFYPTSMFKITIIPVEDKVKIADLMSKEEVKAIVDSIAISGYVTK